jgi:3-dehydroquinate synthase
MTTRIAVGGGGQPPYEVVIGAGLGAEIAGLPVTALAGASQAVIFHQPPVQPYAARVQTLLADSGLPSTLLEIPDGEAAKTVESAAIGWARLGELGLTRSDAVIGVGGGAATDLAGWVAASWLRGIRMVGLPTTLAGMVDAAIGGKTGINTERGKNLVGAFHPPSAVLCDLDVLRTLPAADYRAGLAEVVKCGFIADPVILELIEADPGASVLAGNPAEAELIERSVRVKAAAVTDDLTEQGVRIYLNYGHTLGHAIERAEDYRWRHGDAISVGLVYAAALGRRLGRLDAPTAERHAVILRSLGLPTSYPADAYPALLSTMSVDKKARGTMLRFVILDGLARPGVVADPDPDVLAGAYADISATSLEISAR